MVHRSASLPSTRPPATPTTVRWAAIPRPGSTALASKRPNTVTWWLGCAWLTGRGSGPPIGCWGPIIPPRAGPLAGRSTSWKTSARPASCRSTTGPFMTASISPIFGQVPPVRFTPNITSTAPSGWPIGSISFVTAISISPSPPPTKPPALGNLITLFIIFWMWPWGEEPWGAPCPGTQMPPHLFPKPCWWITFGLIKPVLPLPLRWSLPLGG